MARTRVGTLKELDVAITPVSFQFEGQPFSLKADLQNFQDLKYNIVSKGTIDIGKIYKVFAVPGYDVAGQVETHLSLRGRQSDATAGRYTSGTDVIYSINPKRFVLVDTNATITSPSITLLY